MSEITEITEIQESIKKTVEERFQSFLTVVPFDSNAQPFCIEEDDEYVLGNIYLIDECGGKIKTVSLHETVGECLDKFSLEDRQDVSCVLFPEAQQIAFIPK